MILVWFLVGLALMLIGAELLVRGSVMLATFFRIPMIIAGLTIVAFGTSAPELGVSMQAAMAGEATAGIAIGNVVGSNIFNTLFILGVSALFAPLIIGLTIVRYDIPLMIGVTALVVWLSWDNEISHMEGWLLFSIFVLYNLYTLFLVRKEAGPGNLKDLHPTPRQASTLLMASCFVITGLVMLVFGADWLIYSAVNIALSLGVSQLVIGLTIVAAGTSLPELVTSVMASFKGERDIALGNVIGSNIFNILAVLGLSAIVSPTSLHVSPAAQHLDIPVLLAVSLLCLPVFFKGFKLDRIEGAIFIVSFFAYMGYHFILASTEEGPEDWQMVILIILGIITLISIGQALWRHLRQP